MAISTLVSDDDILRAARGDRSAMRRVLAVNYPRVCRIAFSFCGTAPAANRVIRGVASRSLAVMSSWNSAPESAGWFMHHTLITARQFAPRPILARDDILIIRDMGHTAHFPAFIGAMRNLPEQQTEAFILSHGEGLDPRALAVVMDCSIGAAANHLIAANKTLSAVSGADFERLANALRQVYLALTPSEALVLEKSSARVGRFSARRASRRLVAFLIPLIALGLIALICWKLSRMIVI